MALMTREDLLKREDLTVEKVDLGKGDFVYVRQMTGQERDRFEQSLVREETGPDGEVRYKRNLEDFRAKLAVNCLCDEKGENLLKPGDYPILSKMMSAKRLEKIINKAQELNRITDEDREALVKN